MTDFDLTLIPTQEVGLLLSLAAFAATTISVIIARRVNGDAPASLRYALWGLWGYSFLRLYSASSFIWGPDAADADLFPFLRVLVLAILTLLVVLSFALLGFYWHRLRR